MKQNLRFVMFAAALLLTAIFSSSAHAQDKTITGKVTSSADGNAIPGVSVTLKGSTTGTVTDTEGKYSITVKAESITLVFSSIGFIKQEIIVPNSQSVVDLVLVDDVKALSEVVVTGYASQRKQDITGAVTVISPKELTAVPAASVKEDPKVLQANATKLIAALKALG